MNSSQTAVGENWILGARSGDSSDFSTETNSSTLTILSEDTCTYSSGDWNVDCADNCIISTIVNVGANDINIRGTGTFITKVDIINSGNVNIVGTDSSNICAVPCIGGCFK